MILSPISIPKSRVQVSSHPDPDIELGWGSGTLHSPFKQNLRIYVIQANICFTVDVNFIQFSVNSTLYNTCSDSGYGLQSSSKCWTNLVILVTLSWPGVRREGGRGQCNVWWFSESCYAPRPALPGHRILLTLPPQVPLSLPQPLLTAVANINLLLDAGLLIFNRPLE